jgi:hypothetical protein
MNDVGAECTSHCALGNYIVQCSWTIHIDIGFARLNFRALPLFLPT